MKVFKFLALTIVAISIVSCNNPVANKKSLESAVDSVSYALGLDMANKFKANLPEVNTAVFMQGYVNGMDSINLLIKNEDLMNVIQNYFQKEQAKQMIEQQKQALEEAEKEYGDIKKAGEEFLAENKNKKGIITTTSGLQYEILKEGKGAKPSATSMVKIHYHGTLIDGTVFESSVEKNAPIEMRVNQFIQGWIEGLQLMSEGAKYKFYIPQDLAYGAFPRPGVIKPFMALIFEVELLEIK